ncbi:hypothetical protein B0H16DRAFT_1480623 [Mycena metata]|uniref:Uncharacterized protein n=1 Tax=Mycena metata TaxID=1033252 RepID=A0AAD7H362_9AGAR|nr:hypothetical protein B0H16DRAFT_1480623 [Mycena metata]
MTRNGDPMRNKSAQQREAQRTYTSSSEVDFIQREARNKTELQRKARERMAKRQVQLKAFKDDWAAYNAKAREDHARYREAHRETLVQNEQARRAKSHIAKHRLTAWFDHYKKRHPRPTPAPAEDLPDTEQDAATHAAPSSGLRWGGEKPRSIVH